jgi:hypothetical protein
MEFKELQTIKEFQLFGDNAGYVLSGNSILYSFNGNQTNKIDTLKEFTINDFYFKNDA